MPSIAIIHIAGDHTNADALMSEDIVWPSGARLVGIFDYPAKSELKCHGTCTVKKSGQWGRDPRGFMKCKVCGYRNRKMRGWLMNALFDYLGANISSAAPSAFKTPEGSGLTPGND